MSALNAAAGLSFFFQDAELQVMDFASNPSEARLSINHWVETLTKGHIRDLIPEDGVHENTKLILVSHGSRRVLANSLLAPSMKV